LIILVVHHAIVSLVAAGILEGIEILCPFMVEDGLVVVGHLVGPQMGQDMAMGQQEVMAWVEIIIQTFVLGKGTGFAPILHVTT
jgi:hypothetical protein